MAKNKEGAACTFKTSIGGQALIEGILMRGPEKQSIVCRLADGTLKDKVEVLKLSRTTHPILGVPFLRGIPMFVDSLVNGMKAITYSAEQLPEDQQEQPTKFDLWLEKTFGTEKAQKAVMGFATIVGVLLAIGLFVLLPALLFQFLPQDFRTEHLVVSCLLEGIIRIIIFLIYLWLVTRLDDIKRLFSYHGAEHKTIFCYEKGLELTVENVKKQSRFHPRCGTSFLVVTMLMSILGVALMTWVLTLIPGYTELNGMPQYLVRVLGKLVILPFIVSFTYELNRWVGRHDTNPIARIAAWPGKKIQHLTTREPDESMMEVAIEALKLVIPEKKGADAW